MTREQLLAAAEAALDRSDEAAIAPQLADYQRAHPGDVEVMHWLALLWRELDRREGAVPLLRDAVRLSPADAGLAYALAQVLHEAGLPAVSEFERAVALAPGRGDIRLGLAGARLAAGDGPRALEELGGLLEGSPAWIEGHRQYAQLAALIGRGDGALASIEGALAAHPRHVALHQTATQLLLDAERFEDALAAARRGLALANDTALALGEAAALDELGEAEAAHAAFLRIGPSADHGVLVRRARHFLRTGQVAQATRELEPHLRGEGADALWPYASLAWRALDDPRSAWLEQRPGLVSVVDFDSQTVDLAALQQVLNPLHDRSGRFLDQSVRGGTQTDGNLLARIDPTISALRETIRAAVADHVAGLGEVDPSHPTLSRRQDRPIRFAGSWSVRLREAGFHAAHHHPQGWLSSAFYVALPGGGDEAGALELGGSPPDLGLHLAPLRTVQPRPGRLVLFPSWLWHATRPFPRGTRLTVAFDIKRG